MARRLVITVLVLAALLVAADRISVAVAERIAGTGIQDSQSLAQRPDVSIDGFPFLTQLISSHYDSVEITAHDVPVGPSQRQLLIDTVGVHLHNVTTARSFHSVHAESATADARVTYADLSRTLGATISYAGPGRLTASVSVTVAGRTYSGAVTASVTASSSVGLRFGDVQVAANGVHIAALDDALASVFQVPVPLTGLPFHIRVTGVDVDKAGLVVHFTGTNLAYDSG